MKSLTELWIVVASELATMCDVSAFRDVETLRKRFDHEGESFFTITLPTFARDFERALDLGLVTPDMFPGFRRHAGLPAFLSGFLELVFDRRTSKLLSDPNVFAIYTIRQLTLLFKKLEGDCTKERNRAALESYISCEKELKALDKKGIEEEKLSELSRLGALVWGDAVDLVAQEIDSFALDPAHGSGQTADRIIGNRKFAHSEWTERLEPYFPFGEYALPRWGFWHTVQTDLKFLAPGEERPVKVHLVPKTRKTPRVIAMEPVAMQYCQQGIMRSLVPALQGDSLGMLGFTDQEVNQDLAREGSRFGKLATLDLSEASDRVLNTVVCGLFRYQPSFLEALQACRSRTAVLDDGTSIRLSKFASMGSAVCFPIEAMVFLSIVLYGIQLTEQRRLTASFVRRLSGRVRIYGDDIIVPVEYVDGVVEALESFGLKVNANKSFWTGKFRESCGGDYYDGRDVKPIYLGRPFPTSRREVPQILSWIELINALRGRGLFSSSEWAHGQIKPLLGELPMVPFESDALGIRVDNGFTIGRFGPSSHMPEVKAWTVSQQKREIATDGWSALRKVFTGDYSDPLMRDHLRFSGRPVSARMQKRWVAVG